MKFDAASNGNAYSVNSVSVNCNHIVGGTNGILIAGVTLWGSSNVPTCTYNGVAMTLIGSYSAGNTHVHLYYLINPDLGSHTLQATTTGSTLGMEIGGISINGAKQTDQPDAYAGNSTGSGTSLTTNITTADVNAWAIAYSARFNDGGLSAGAGETVRTSSRYMTMTTKPDLAVGSNSVAANVSVADNIVTAVCSLKLFPVGAAMMGVFL